MSNNASDDNASSNNSDSPPDDEENNASDKPMSWTAYLMANWYWVLAVLVVLIAVGVAAVMYLKPPTPSAAFPVAPPYVPVVTSNVPVATVPALGVPRDPSVPQSRPHYGSQYSWNPAAQQWIPIQAFSPPPR